MSASIGGSIDPVERREQARRLAQQALAAQRAGNDAEATRLFDQASQLDPDAVADVLHATGADAAADARDSTTDRSTH